MAKTPKDIEKAFAETLAAWKALHVRINQYTVAAFTFFALSAIVTLTELDTRFQGIKMDPATAAVVLVAAGTTGVLLRVLNFFGAAVYLVRLQQLHKQLYSNEARVWSYAPLDTVGLFTILQSAGGAALVLKRIFAIYFFLPVAVVAERFAQGPLKLSFTHSAIACLCAAIFISALVLEYLVGQTALPSQVCSALDKHDWQDGS